VPNKKHSKAFIRKNTYHQARLFLKYKEKYQLITKLFRLKAKPTHAIKANRQAKKIRFLIL
jgi:hypothetical protein